jgi:hypothetical protein
MKNMRNAVFGIVALVALMGIVSATDMTPQITSDPFFAGFSDHMTNFNAYNAAMNTYNGINQVTATIGGITYRFGAFADGHHFDAFVENIP